MTELLQVNGLSVRFSGLTALDDVSFTLEEGAVRAVIGPNGAGKSTLFNAISGYVTPTSGTVHLKGQELTTLTPHEIAEQGVRRTFQNGGLFPELTVLENVLTGLHAQIEGSFLDILLGRSKALKSEAENIHRARELLKLMSMDHMADTRAGDLSGGQQRIVEIVRTVASDPPVLLLDEPAVGLSPVARAQMMEIIHRLAGEKGVGILLIEHAVELVMAAADRILVMAAGARIAEGTPEEIREDRAVLEAYLGHSEPLLKIRDLHVGYGKKPILRGATYDVLPGECLTLLGANGSGKSTSLNAVCGFVKPSAGSVLFDGIETAGLSPHKIFSHGIAQVSQARDLFPDLTVEDNLRLGAMRRGGKEISQTLQLVYERFPRLAERRKQPTRTLSGGEQQMVAIGRALMSRPRLLLLDEPSGGLSPQFCEEIAKIIDTLKEDGVTMLMVEQNLNLAFRAADRFIVLRDGEVVDGGDVRAMAGDHDAIVREIYL